MTTHRKNLLLQNHAGCQGPHRVAVPVKMINSDYFPRHHLMTAIYYGNVAFFGSRNRIMKYY
jgi:hypothetical protein